MEALWKQVLRSAIAGTERLPLRAPMPSWLPHGSNDTEQLLHALSAVHLLRKANKLCPILEAYPAPAPTNPLPPCPPACARALHLILSGVFPHAFPEFLVLHEAAKVAWPDALLPETFDWVLKRPQFWKKIQEQTGPKGQWLLVQNPAWAELLEKKAVDWGTGSFSERLELLAQIRKTDPHTARQMLDACWNVEPADYREQFLLCLRNNLTAADFPFLEKALTDRSKKVQSAAQAILVLLPESRFGIDSRALLALCIGENPSNLLVRRALEKNSVLEAQFILWLQTMGPAAIDYPLYQLLQAWAGEPGWCAALPDGAVWQGQWHVAPAILQFLTDNKGHVLWESPALERFLLQAPLETWEMAIKSLLDSGSDGLENPSAVMASALLKRSDVWPSGLASKVMEQLLQLADKSWMQPNEAILRQLLEQLAYQCRLEEGFAALQRIPEKHKMYRWQQSFDRMAAILAFRSRMKAGFQESTGPKQQL